MPRTTHTTGSFRKLVGTFDGATDPSRNGNLGKPQRLMSGYETQLLYFSGNSGNGMNLGGTGIGGNITTGAPVRATASFEVGSTTHTSTLYFQIADEGVGTFDLTFSGAPALAAPIPLSGIAVGMSTLDAITAAKSAIDGDVTLAALFDTVIQEDTPAAGTTRLAIIAKKLGAICNNIEMTFVIPAGGTPDYNTYNASYALSSYFSGGDTDSNRFFIGEYSFDGDLCLTGIAGFPALVDDDATRQDVADALAAAISRLPQFSAAAIGTAVNILGPDGPDGGTYPYRILQSGVANYITITPTTGFFALGAPTITGPTLS